MIKTTEEKLKADEFTISSCKIWLYPDSFDKTTIKTYTIDNIEIEETKWGNRAKFEISNADGEWQITSWNLVIPKGGKFKPSELIGKQMQLAYKTDKKLACEFR